jgi:hypothetical protein
MDHDGVPNGEINGDEEEVANAAARLEDDDESTFAEEDAAELYGFEDEEEPEGEDLMDNPEQ